MITKYELIKGSPEEIIEYITTQPNYTSHLGGELDINEQLEKIGLEKTGIVFYLEKRSDTEMSLVSIYVHPIDLVKRELSRQSILGTMNNNYEKTN